MKRNWFVLPLALLICLLVTGTAFAVTRTVPDQYYSVQSAMNAAQSGDMVYVRAGTYNGNITMKDNVDLVGEGAEVTTLNLSTTYLTAGNNALIEGFTITGYGIFCSSKSPFIRHNIFRNTATDAIYITGKSWPTIFKNYFYRNRGGILSNGTATIVNNTFVDNRFYGIKYVANSGFPVMNNLVLRHNEGIVISSSPYVYTGGYNNVYDSTSRNFYPSQSNLTDLQQDPRLTNAPISYDSARLEVTANGGDTVHFYSDLRDQYTIGNYLEVGYDNVVRQVTDVSYGLFDGQTRNSTRVSFNPPLQLSSGSVVYIFNWGTSNNFTYDFTYQTGSPCIDGGNPDPLYVDADGSINDIGAVGGTTITAAYDPTPPPAVLAFSVSAGDAEATLSWTPSVDPRLKGFVILRSTGAPVEGVPVNGGTYNVFGTSSYRNVIGNSKVVYSSQDPSVGSFVDTDLMPDVEYHYAIFVLNDFYIYSAAATGSVVSSHLPQTFTVTPDGSGDFTNITEAIAFAKPTDTVHLSAGQYREEIIFKNGVHLVGESMDTVTLLPVNGLNNLIHARNCEFGSVENLTFKNDQTSGSISAIYQDFAANLDVKNVRIDGFNTAIWYRGPSFINSKTATVENSIFENNGTAIYCYQHMSPKIINNTFTNNSGSGVYSKYSCNPEIIANHFEGNGIAVYSWEDSKPLIADNTMLRNGSGISNAWRSHPTILRNLISESVGNGIYAVSHSSPRIISNVISKNGRDGIWLFLSWPQVYNNTIVENAGNGLSIDYYGSVSPRNNIIAFNGGWGAADVTSYPAYLNLYYNDMFGNDLGEASPSARVYTGNLFTDPLFVDIAESNYQLTSASPAVDAGDPNMYYNDLDGSRNDMGAYGGPEAMVGDEPTIEEEIDSIVTTLVTLPDNVFKNEATDRLGSLEDKFTEVITLINAGSEEADPLIAEGYYADALSKLENDLLKKCDGHFGGKLNNDWITSYEAQSVVYPMIIDLINEVEMLLIDLAI